MRDANSAEIPSVLIRVFRECAQPIEVAMIDDHGRFEAETHARPRQAPMKLAVRAVGASYEGAVTIEQLLPIAHVGAGDVSHPSSLRTRHPLGELAKIGTPPDVAFRIPVSDCAPDGHVVRSVRRDNSLDPVRSRHAVGIDLGHNPTPCQGYAYIARITAVSPLVEMADRHLGKLLLYQHVGPVFGTVNYEHLESIRCRLASETLQAARDGAACVVRGNDD